MEQVEPVLFFSQNCIVIFRVSIRMNTDQSVLVGISVCCLTVLFYLSIIIYHSNYQLLAFDPTFELELPN